RREGRADGLRLMGAVNSAPPRPRRATWTSWSPTPRGAVGRPGWTASAGETLGQRFDQGPVTVPLDGLCPSCIVPSFQSRGRAVEMASRRIGAVLAVGVIACFGGCGTLENCDGGPPGGKQRVFGGVRFDAEMIGQGFGLPPPEWSGFA